MRTKTECTDKLVLPLLVHPSIVAYPHYSVVTLSLLPPPCSEDVIRKARAQSTNIVRVSQSLGIKQAYVQETPLPKYAPMNGEGYITALYWDNAVRKLFQGLEPASTMLKTSKGGTFDDPVDATSPREAPKDRAVNRSPIYHIGNVGVATAAVGYALIENAGALGAEGIAERLGGRTMEFVGTFFTSMFN